MQFFGTFPTVDLCYLTSEENYTLGLAINDVKLTGIKTYCLFNDLPTFHVTKNYVVDIVHDLFEGVCRYDLCEILLYFISEKKLFSIQAFNYRKQMFNYGETEIGNLSPPLEIGHLLNNKIKMSAREMMTFVHFLPLIIGDKIPIDNKVWKYFITLLNIVDILLMSRFDEPLLNKLHTLIQFHNETYMELFKKPLKPKYHFLNHYVNIIKQSGPPKYLWSFRYESKHREAKTYARNITSRKNITYTLSIKASLKFTTFLNEHANGLPNQTKFEKSYFFNIENSEYFNFIKNFDCFKPDFANNLAIKSVTFKGTFYKKGYFLTIKCNDVVDLYEIREIIISINNHLSVIAIKHEILYFSEHYQSYVVGSKNKFFEILNLKLFTGVPIHLYYISDGTTLIRNKEF